MKQLQSTTCRHILFDVNPASEAVIVEMALDAHTSGSIVLVVADQYVLAAVHFAYVSFVSCIEKATTTTRKININIHYQYHKEAATKMSDSSNVGNENYACLWQF